MVDTAPAPAETGPSSSAPLPDLPDLSVVPPVWGRITNLVVERGEGSWLITRDGERYLDYSAGIGVTNTGHAHPRVVAAIQEQASKIIHAQQNITYHEPGLRLYDRLFSVENPEQVRDGRTFLDNLPMSQSDLAKFAHGNADRLLKLST